MNLSVILNVVAIVVCAATILYVNWGVRSMRAHARTVRRHAKLAVEAQQRCEEAQRRCEQILEEIRRSGRTAHGTATGSRT